MTESAPGQVSALTIAGFDPSGGAGAIADARAMACMGVYPAAVVTAITFQSTSGVRSYEALARETVAGQLDSLLKDMQPAATKTGMLPTADHVELVARRSGAMGQLVVDPVARSSSGAPLAGDDAVAALRRDLIPVCDLLTPNLHEAEDIGGVAINSKRDAEECARAIVALGAGAVCITGGHWTESSGDLFHDGENLTWFGGHDEMVGIALHGTGCCFSAMAAAGMALGQDAAAAVEAAGRATLDAIRNAVRPGSGMSVPWPRAT